MADTDEGLITLAKKYSDLHRQVDAAIRLAEQHARSGSLEYDERTRWRRFAAQLAEALRG